MKTEARLKEYRRDIACFFCVGYGGEEQAEGIGGRGGGTDAITE